jgi:adenylylsulfate kinase
MKILIMGLPGAGKTTLAEQLQKKLKCVWFNADEIRNHINRDLGFTEQDRYEHATRMGRLCSIVSRADQYVIADFVCPTQETRTAFSPDFIIWLDTVTEGRYDDTNTLFEKPTYCQLTVDTWDYDINEIVKFIRQYESR